jgi:hypothetical protein
VKCPFPFGVEAGFRRAVVRGGAVRKEDPCDTVFDIEEGKNAGCGLSIGITTGTHTRERLASARPDHIVDHLAEIPSLI